MKLSGVPEKARPSEFGGFWLCTCIRAIVYRCSTFCYNPVCYAIFQGGIRRPKILANNALFWTIVLGMAQMPHNAFSKLPNSNLSRSGSGGGCKISKNDENKAQSSV